MNSSLTPALDAKLRMSAEMLFARGREMFGIGKYDEANEAYQKGLAAAPEDHEGWTGLADVFWVVESWNQAENCYRQALKLKPGFPPAVIGLAETLTHRGRPDEALPLLHDIGKHHQPADIEVAYGNAYMAQDRYRLARKHYRRAARLVPHDAACWRDLAIVSEIQGDFDDALGFYETAVQVSLNNPDGWFSRFTVGCAYLLRGHHQHGWTMYEYRKHNPVWGDHQMYKNDRQWEGEQVSGTLLLYEEQGLGDLIQFLRYVPLTAAKCERLVLDIRHDHRCLVSLMDLPHNVIVKGDLHIPYDCVCPMLSQPFMLKVWEPLEVGAYLNPSAVHQSPYCMGAVALTWYGNPKHKNDRRRSIPLELLAPLVRSRPDIQWITFSPEDKAREDIARTGLPIGQVQRQDLAQVAHAMDGCDLLISVDTSHLHLAGALGVPAWGLIPFSPDWRWGLNRSDTPWYASLRLYRQTETKDGWAAVVNRVQQDLKEWKP